MYPGCDVVRKKTLLTFVIPETLHVITFLCHTSHIMYIGGARRKLKRMALLPQPRTSLVLGLDLE